MVSLGGVIFHGGFLYRSTEARRRSVLGSQRSRKLSTVSVGERRMSASPRKMSTVGTRNQRCNSAFILPKEQRQIDIAERGYADSSVFAQALAHVSPRDSDEDPPPPPRRRREGSEPRRRERSEQLLKDR